MQKKLENDENCSEGERDINSDLLRVSSHLLSIKKVGFVKEEGEGRTTLKAFSTREKNEKHLTERGKRFPATFNTVLVQNATCMKRAQTTD